MARLRLRFQFGEYQPWRLPRRVLVFYLPPPLGAVVASGGGGTSQASLGKVEAVSVACRRTKQACGVQRRLGGGTAWLALAAIGPSSITVVAWRKA